MADTEQFAVNETYPDGTECSTIPGNYNGQLSFFKMFNKRVHPLNVLLLDEWTYGFPYEFRLVVPDPTVNMFCTTEDQAREHMKMFQPQFVELWRWDIKKGQYVKFIQ